MKNQTNNQTAGTVLTRGIETLLAIKNMPVATAKEVQRLVMPDSSLRTVQRYLTGLEQLGLVRRHGGGNGGCRYFLDGQAKQLFQELAIGSDA